MQPRIAFLGTPAVAVPALQVLAKASGVKAVFCNPDRPTGRGQKWAAPPVKEAAVGLNLPLHQPARWKDAETRALWESLGIDLAVVVAYGHILPTWMLESLRLGAWNLHFSLLPKWRGAAPVNHAILAGDSETGVSLMRITQGLDEGPVLAMSNRPIGLGDDAAGLLALLAEDAAELLALHLRELSDGTAMPCPQSGAASTASKLKKEMAQIDVTGSALDLHRRVRALQPWPGTEVHFDDTVLKVLSVGGIGPSSRPCGILAWDKGGAWLTCGDGQAVELVRLQRAGKPPQPALQALQPFGPQGEGLID